MVMLMELYDEQYKEGTKKMMEASKEVMEAYKNYQKTLLEKSPFDKKTTELLMLAASCAIQCSYCIDTHSKRAKLLLMPKSRTQSSWLRLSSTAQQ